MIEGLERYEFNTPSYTYDEFLILLKKEPMGDNLKKILIYLKNQNNIRLNHLRNEDGVKWLYNSFIDYLEIIKWKNT